MTPEEIKTLGHAFFDGKTLQYRVCNTWVTHTAQYCPDFLNDAEEWRIKPDEPKKVKFLGWLGVNGDLRQILASESWPNQKGLVRIPELDREITLPEGE